MGPFLYILGGLAVFGIGVLVGRSTVRIENPLLGTEDEQEEMQNSAQRAVADRIEKRKQRILDVAQKAGRITNDEVEDLFCISDGTARRYLNELEQDGRLEQEGETGRGVHYVPR